MTAARHMEIPIADVVESPTNPRKDFGDLTEITESIRQKGVLQPVLARELDSGDYELVFGHRRLRAAKKAGLETIPAMVRDMSDKEVLEAQLIENAQRQDIHPLEEAEGYQRLVKDHGYTVDDLAAKVGKSKSAVHARLKLCDLTPATRKAFMDGKVTAAVAYLLARIDDPGVQAEALLAVTSDYGRPLEQPMVFKHAAELIQRRFMLQLAGAPFDTNDEDLLPLVGACTNCPKRSGNQKEMFSDVKSKDVCTDPACFARKREAGWKKLSAAAQAEGKRVLNQKETKRVFPYEYSQEPCHDSPYVDLKSRCFDDPKQRTYGQLVGKLAAVAITRDPQGKVHELVDRSQVPVLLRKSGHTFKAPERKPDPWVKRQRAAADKSKVLTKVAHVAIGKIAGFLGGEPNQKALQAIWMLLAGAAVSHWAFDDEVAKLCGAPSMKDLEKMLPKVNVQQLQALVVVKDLMQSLPGHLTTIPKDFEAICVVAGVDLKVLQKALAPEKTSKKKPAKKKAA